MSTWSMSLQSTTCLYVHCNPSIPWEWKGAPSLTICITLLQSLCHYTYCLCILLHQCLGGSTSTLIISCLHLLLSYVILSLPPSHRTFSPFLLFLSPFLLLSLHPSFSLPHSFPPPLSIAVPSLSPCPFEISHNTVTPSYLWSSSSFYPALFCFLHSLVVYTCLSKSLFTPSMNLSFLLSSTQFCSPLALHSFVPIHSLIQPILSYSHSFQLSCHLG